MKIFFSHGKLGNPKGTKIVEMSNLATALGFSTNIIDYTDTINPDERAIMLEQIIKQEKDDYILVGSSMGAYISLIVTEKVKNKPKGIFMLAPALYLEGYNIQEFAPCIKKVEIIHGWNDKTVPYQNSIKFCSNGNYTLHLVDSDHGLYSELDTVLDIFSRFLGDFKKKA